MEIIIENISNYCYFIVKFINFTIKISFILLNIGQSMIALVTS